MRTQSALDRMAVGKPPGAAIRFTIEPVPDQIVKVNADADQLHIAFPSRIFDALWRLSAPSVCLGSQSLNASRPFLTIDRKSRFGTSYAEQTGQTLSGIFVGSAQTTMRFCAALRMNRQA